VERSTAGEIDQFAADLAAPGRAEAAGLPWWRRIDESWREALWTFVISRAMLALLTVIGLGRYGSLSAATGRPKAPFQCVHDLHQCGTGWLRWDAALYVSIEVHGYQGGSSVAFLPAWPLLVRLFAAPFGGGWVAAYYTGVVLANVLLYVTLVLLYTLLRLDLGVEVARRAVFFLAFSPMAIFFATGYAESLYVPLTIAVFLLLRRRSYLLAGLCAGAATATRPHAVALVLPFLVVLVRRFGFRGLWRREDLREKARMLGGLALVPSGLVAYMIYLWHRVGDPLAFAKWQQLAWKRRTTPPWTPVADSVRALFDPGRSFELNLHNLTFLALAAVALAVTWRRLPLPYGLFALGTLVFVLINPFPTTEALAAVPRHLAACFPFVVAYAVWATRRPRVNMALTVLFLVYFSYDTVAFVTNRWVA
jgi:hypothetical protein